MAGNPSLGCPFCPKYFSGVDFYQVEQALCPSAYIIYYYVIQMPGTLRLILNLFDDLLDNFFSFFLFSSSNKFIQNHSSSDQVIKGQKRSQKVKSSKTFRKGKVLILKIEGCID